MRSHKFSVGLLSELAPHEHPNLLGLNVNAGQSILLRIRTDAYDGFRSYAEIRRVLCHELTHNVYGGHGDDVSSCTDSHWTSTEIDSVQDLKFTAKS
jgi:hypothetical protein